MKSKKFFIGVLFLMIFVGALILYNYLKLEVNFIDVGQGDSSLISTHGKHILIDSGGIINGDYDVGERVIMPFLLHKKILFLDYVIITHFDYDHYGGLIYLLNNYTIKNIIVTKQKNISKEFIEFMNLVKKKGVNVIIYSAGDVLLINRYVYFYCLYPDNEYIPENLNNNSIVLKFIYYNLSFLFTGDIEKEVEDYLINKYKDILHSNIIKVSHHGSSTSSTKKFIEFVNPEISVISVGKRNTYGHPNINVLNILSCYSNKIYRTDENGQITVKSLINLYKTENIMYKKYILENNINKGE